jgi:hypothetical protein
MDQMRPRWQYTARGFLWQIQTGSARYLVGEDRDPGGKRVTFFCLDRQSGKARWEGLNSGHEWWTGIEAVTDDVVLFHGFASPDLPLHKGLHAVELGTGGLLWKNPDVRFLNIQSSTLLVSSESPERNSFLELSLSSGAVLGEVGSHGGTSHSSLPRESQGILPAEFPRQLLPVDFTRQVFWSDLRRKLPSDALERSILVLPAGNRCVASYCAPTGSHSDEHPDLCSMLVVFDSRGFVPLYADTTNPHAAAVNLEPFFVQDDMLYYVKQRSTLVAVSFRTA